MSVKNYVMQRKLGAFELLVGLIVVELFLGTRLMLLITIGLAFAFFFLKMHFKGEFSLEQFFGLFGSDKKENQEKPTT